MTRWIAAVFAMTALAGASPAFAQNAPARIEVSVFPGGGLFFTEDAGSGEPDFGNYVLGGAVAVAFNRFFAVEGEVSGALGVSQSVRFDGVTLDRKTPNLVSYTGNVVFSVPTETAVVPYVTGGVGGLSLLERETFGLDSTETFLTGNIGGGVKWYAGRWGLRGDYRFIGVQSKEDAPAFFGRTNRYGHRLYGAVLVHVGR
jgi:hypothetical protein